MSDPKQAKAAYKAAQQARDRADGATDVERALIEALAVRYENPPPEEREELDVAYADAMREVWQRFPDDPLVGVLFADALMNINQDWRSWGKDEERGEYTPEAIATLERVLEFEFLVVDSVELWRNNVRCVGPRRSGARGPCSGRWQIKLEVVVFAIL